MKSNVIKERICVICGEKYFYKICKRSVRISGLVLRQRNSITCSRKCSRILRGTEKKTAQARAYNKEYQKRYRRKKK